MNEFEQLTTELMDFIADSPSPFHVTENFARMLIGCGFRRLSEGQLWDLTPGSDYFVTRNDSSLIAFRIPDAVEGSERVTFENFQIVSAHSDSPSFKIKENGEITNDFYTKLNVEKYGGMLCAPWMDRPLSIAGRAIVKNGNVLESDLINIDRDLVMIPNVAIHMNREANDGFKYSIQTDMAPILGDGEAKGALAEIIASELETEPENVLSTDLFLYNRVPGTIWGANREFYSCTKLDDLQCAWSAITALMDGTNERSICVAAIFDNEEVGSSTKQGADSTFLEDTLRRICDCLGMDNQYFQMMTARSFMVSADNAHAVHPNHPEKADPTNRPYMNKGPVIKFHAGQKYTTDAVSASIFREICDRAEVPTQVFANHSDANGGSTLGNISNAHISLNTVDIGMAQLAMHSPYETGGIKDTKYLVSALTAFYRTHITCGDSRFILD